MKNSTLDGIQLVLFSMVPAILWVIIELLEGVVSKDYIAMIMIFLILIWSGFGFYMLSKEVTKKDKW